MIIKEKRTTAADRLREDLRRIQYWIDQELRHGRKVGRASKAAVKIKQALIREEAR